MDDHGVTFSLMSDSYPIAPPIEPMLAKLADDLPAAGDFLFEPKWDGFRAIVFRGASDVFIQSRDLRPLDRYFPELHEALLEKLPARLRDRRRDRDRDAARARFRRAAAAAASRGLAGRQAREGDAGLVRRLRPAGGRRAETGWRRRRASGGRCWNGCSRRRRAAGPPHADDAGPRTAARVARPVRGRRARRRDRQAGGQPLPARQARDDQGEARAHRRLRRRRVPLAQEREGRGGLAAAGPVRRRAACCSTSG